LHVTSDLYKTILQTPGHEKEHRAFIAGVEQKILKKAETKYSNLNMPPLVKGSLFVGSKPSVGGCVSRQIDIMIKPKGTIPRMAEIKLETRLVLKDFVTGEITSTSEWLPKGTFYIDTRQTDKVSGALIIHGYDAMLKAEQPFLTETTEDDWPKPMDEVVEEIAERMGVKVDSRTVVSHTLQAGYPLEYTMREVLGFIASAHAGNWIITDAGELRLVGLADIPPETFYLVTEDGDAILFGDTRILI
jgi:hypothetical protein